jgi:RNA polymerase sigma factor (sigma-70 family)
MTEDHGLLNQYVRDGSHPALDELIRRHLSLVYSAAIRQVRDPHLAEDVTQAVFMVLAEKAHTIRHGVAVGGWLLSVARRAAVNAMRKEARRRRHESRAAATEMSSAICQTADDWNEVAPLLDAELNRLASKDRDAVVLRFFQDRTFAQVGEELGLSEAAARKRVVRALERLRRLLSRRGASISVAALGLAITGRAAQAAPIHLLSSATAGIGAPTATSATIAKGTLHMMAWAKAKLVGSVAAAFVLVAAAVATTAALAQQADESSELIREFQTEYPAAEAKLEEAYSHVQIVDRETRFDTSQSKTPTIDNMEILREGNSIRGERTRVDSAQANFPPGSLWVGWGDKQKYSVATKIFGHANFTVTSSGPEPNLEDDVRFRYLPLSAPFCIQLRPVPDYLKDWDRKLLWARHTKLDGTDAIEILVQATVAANKFRDHLFFQPHTWALLGWTLQFNHEKVRNAIKQARITYEPDSTAPKVKTVQNWYAEDLATDVKTQFRSVDVISVEFGAIPAEEFTPAAVGVDPGP